MKRECPTCHRAYGKRNRCYYCNPGRPRRSKPRICEQCGKRFSVAPYRVRKSRKHARFCSLRCWNISQRGKTRRPRTDYRYKHSGGYICVRVAPNIYELEHRVIVAKALARPLRRDEHVHHINGDRADNRLDNLLLVSASEHAKLHPDWPQYQRARMTLTCRWCGKKYEVIRCRADKSIGCSIRCAASWREARKREMKRRNHHG
jgi:hypothetical protein